MCLGIYSDNAYLPVCMWVSSLKINTSKMQVCSLISNENCCVFTYVCTNNYNKEELMYERSPYN